jgi:ABC-type glutathione transport system ATPase component
MSAPILSARRLRRTFPSGTPGADPVVAVDDVDLEVLPGEIVGLVGESGSGKTTLGKVLLRIVEPEGGELTLGEVDLRALDSSRLRAARRRMQMVYQSASASLNPGMTVIEHLAETIQLHRPELRERADQVIEETLARFRLQGRGDRRPHELSGGERRRVGVARCLLPDPDLVIADEPTAGLDASVKADVLQVMLAARRDDQAWIFISHELDVVRYVSDRVLVMYRGSIIEEMPADHLDPRVAARMAHPYTERLLSTGLGRDEAPIAAATREHEPAGCRYAAACHAVEPRTDLWARCCSSAPELVTVGPGHRVACHGRTPAMES